MLSPLAHWIVQSSPHPTLPSLEPGSHYIVASMASTSVPASQRSSHGLYYLLPVILQGSPIPPAGATASFSTSYTSNASLGWGPDALSSVGASSEHWGIEMVEGTHSMTPFMWRTYPN